MATKCSGRLPSAPAAACSTPSAPASSFNARFNAAARIIGSLAQADKRYFAGGQTIKSIRQPADENHPLKIAGRHFVPGSNACLQALFLRRLASLRAKISALAALAA